jgi:glycosyltransferase involved in cell wall biosynthesis
LSSSSLSPNKKTSTVLLIDNDGFSNYTCYFARGISKYRDVILYGFSEESFHVTGAANENGIKYHSLKNRLPRGYSAIKGVVRVFVLFFVLLSVLFRTKYDIVHVQDYLPTFFLFIPLLKLKRKQICWTLHDVEIFKFATGISGRIQELFLKVVSQPTLMANYVDKILVHAYSLKEQLIEKKVDEKKIYVIRIFDYDYLLEYENDNEKKKSNYPKFEDGYILFLGNIAPWKGIDTLIDAVKIALNNIDQKFNLIIAGESYEGLKNIKYFENLNNEDMKNVKFIDRYITDPEIPDLVRKASFLVLPYNNLFRHSASGVIPLAYTFAKPVIVSNIPSLSEYVENGKTGLIFDVEDSRQLANCMIELIENNSKCIEMGQRAHEKMLNEMSLDVCCRFINNVYDKLD